MANNDSPFGLRYVRNLQGNYNSSGQSRYRITTADATNTTNIYQGDIVTQNTAGIVTRIARADGGSPTPPQIIAAHVTMGPVNHFFEKAAGGVFIKHA